MLDFSVLGADMHSHLIPGIDDGSQSVESSLRMMDGLMAMGFDRFITTPHIMTEVFPNMRDNITKEYADLCSAIDTRQYRLRVAAEYFVDDAFPDRVRNGENFLTFGDNFILIEVSMMSREKKLEETIFELNLRGYKPVLAHVERYPYMFENNKLSYYAGLMDAEVFLQVNLRSFAGNYGEVQKKIARLLAENEMISFLGTDIHHESQLPILHQAMKDPHVQGLLRQGKLMNQKIN